MAIRTLEHISILKDTHLIAITIDKQMLVDRLDSSVSLALRISNALIALISVNPFETLFT